MCLPPTCEINLRSNMRKARSGSRSCAGRLKHRSRLQPCKCCAARACASRHRQFRSQQGHRGQRRRHRSRFRESTLLAVSERDERRRHRHALALRDARRDRVAPLRLVRGDVRERLAGANHGLPGPQASRTRAISARSRLPTAAAWTATASGRKPRQWFRRTRPGPPCERPAELGRRLGGGAARDD